MKGEKQLDNNSFIQQITENCINEKTGVFDEVYRRFIIQFLLKVNDIINNFAEETLNISLQKKRILTELAKAYKQILIHICQKTLIVEISNQANFLWGESEEEKYNYFVNTFMEENFERIFAQDSPLMHIIKTKESALCNSIQIFFENLYKDIDIIENLLDQHIERINEISIGDGDTHNGGKSVYVITLNDEIKVVYKPHSLINDEIFSKVLDILNNQNRLRLKLQHVKFANVGDHGWQVFVKRETCSNEREIEDYMYRFGCYVFLCYLLNCTDMHLENIIAAKDYPYLIDIETLFTNQYVFRGTRWKKASDFEQQLCNSVFASVLLPMNIAGMKAESRLDISGLEGGLEEINIKSDVIVNAGRSDICYETMDIRIDDTLNLNNAVTLAGKPILPELYIESLIEGFRECYSLFLSTDATDRILRIQELQMGKFRQVLRNTKLYYKYLEASYHPYYMNSEGGRDIVFNGLSGSGIVSKEHLLVVSAEQEQLLEEDIPYFYTGYKTKSLYSVNGKVAEDFFEKTIEEIFKERIQLLSQKDMSIQEYFIRVSVYGKAKYNRTGYFNLKSKGIHTILSYIFNTHELKSIDGRNDYFNIVEEEERCCIGILPFNLYNGGGMAFILLGLYKETRNVICLEVFKRLRYISDIPLEEIYKYNKSLGMYDGCGSLLYLSYNAAKVTEDFYYNKKFSEYLDFFWNVDINQYTEMDIISGCAGIVLFLSNVYDDCGDPKVLRVLEKFNERLIKAYKEEKMPNQTGFAHGFAGMSLALLKAATNLESLSSYNAGIDLIKRENRYYLKESNNWIDLRSGKESINAWCYGIAGILLSRIEAFSHTRVQHKRELRKDIERCFKEIMNYDSWSEYDDILCHGTLGNLDVIRQYHTKFEQTNVYKKISYEVDKKIETYGLKGRNIPGVYNIDFMEGLTGYCYHKIREHNEKMPCILLLETF